MIEIVANDGEKNNPWGKLTILVVFGNIQTPQGGAMSTIDRIPTPSIERLTKETVSEVDRVRLAMLLRQLSPDLPPGQGFHLNEEALGLSHVYVFVAREAHDALIIGTASLHVVPQLRLTFGTVHEVVVDEQCRGTRIGTLLVHTIIAKARVLGLEHLDLLSGSHRHVARKLYQKLGFQPRDTDAFRLRLVGQ